MEKGEYRLVSSARIGNIQVTSGDILREIATNKTVKVLNVLTNQEGNFMLLVEYNSPGNFGAPFQKSLESFAFLS